MLYNNVVTIPVISCSTPHSMNYTDWLMLYPFTSIILCHILIIMLYNKVRNMNHISIPFQTYSHWHSHWPSPKSSYKVCIDMQTIYGKMGDGGCVFPFRTFWTIVMYDIQNISTILLLTVWTIVTWYDIILHHTLS